MSLIERLAPHILQTLIWIPTRFVLWTFARFKVTGLENLHSLKQGVIFASNHSNALDVILLPAGLPFFSRFMPIFYTSRERSFYKTKTWWEKILYMEWMFWIWGAHKVLVGKKDYSISLKKHVEILNNKKSLLIFPEGRTTRDGKLQEPKAGIGYLADVTSLSIVPVAMVGTYAISFRDFFSRKKGLELRVGKPLFNKDLWGEKKDLDIEDYKHGAEIVMSKISELLVNNSK